MSVQSTQVMQDNVLLSNFFVVWDLLLPYLTERQALNIFCSCKGIQEIFLHNAAIENGGLWVWKLLAPLDFAQCSFSRLEIDDAEQQKDVNIQDDEDMSLARKIEIKEKICTRVAVMVTREYPSKKSYDYFLHHTIIDRIFFVFKYRSSRYPLHVCYTYGIRYRVNFFIQTQKKRKRNQISSSSNATVTRFALSYKSHYLGNDDSR